jgi:NAD(P)-dependent dehydrogenase (short-subunit alcohol dehydrogenase family)
VLPEMIGQTYGKIVSIISDAGRVGEPRLGAYSMAKGGVVAFSKAIAKENGRFRINVNCVSPGATATPATGDLVESASSGDEEAQARLNQLLRVYPIGRGLQRLGMPQDIANAVTFLVSDRAEWITGQTLSVSGGYSMV